METMLDNIYQEQEVLNKILIEFSNKNREILTKLKCIHLKKVLILATGSSINAAKTSKYFLEKVLNIKIYIEEPAMFNSYEKLDTEIDLVIGISQSGKSVSTINAIEKIKNIPILIITSDSLSPLSRYSDMVLNLNMGIEKVGFVTKGFTSTVLNLYLLGISLNSGDSSSSKKIMGKYINDLEVIIKNIPKIIEEANLYVEKNKEILETSNRFICIGYGSNYGICKEFETKFTEVVRCPSTGFELEEYMHGPYLEANKNHIIFYLDSGGILSERLRSLQLYMDKYIKLSVKISIANKVEKNTITLGGLETLDKDLISLLFIIPIQILSYKIAKLKKIDVETKIFTDFDNILKSKI